MEPGTTELQKTSTFKFEDGSCLRTLAREIFVVTSSRNSLKLFFIHFFSPLFSTLHLQPELAPFVDEPSWLVATSEEVVAVLVDSKSFPFICSFSPLFNALHLQLAPLVDEPLWLVSAAEVIAVDSKPYPFFRVHLFFFGGSEFESPLFSSSTNNFLLRHQHHQYRD